MQTSSNQNAANLEKQFLHLLFQPYKYLVFLPLFVLSTNLVCAVIVLLVTIGLSKVARFVPILWARLNVPFALSKVHVKQRENIDPKQSYVVVANHQSHFDILAIYGWLGIDFRWVMKQELRKVPGLGIACEKLGHVYVDRSNHIKAKQSVENAKATIHGGTSIFFFPEGTRSLNGHLLPFKRGAFKFAKELGLPILPVTINGSHKILPTKTLNLFPGSMELIIHEPIASTDKTEQELSQLAKDQITSALELD